MSRDVDHEVFEELAAVRALDALDGADRARFEAHLAGGCARCEAVLRDSAEALAGVAREAPPLAPPPEIRRALLERLQPSAPRPVARARRFGWVPWALGTVAAALVAAAVTGTLVAVRYQASLEHMARETAAIRARVDAQDLAIRTQLTGYREIVDLLRDPATRIVPLHGAGPAPQALGRMVWHPARGGQLFVASLPPPPAGKTYELWTITAGAPRRAGVFTTDASGSETQPVTTTAQPPVDVFAVTIEPRGGVPAPTGPIVLASR